MKNRQKKKLVSMLLTFAIVMGLLSALTVTVGAIPPSLTRTFNINWTIPAGETWRGSIAQHLNVTDFLTVSLTFIPQALLPSSPRTVDIGIVGFTNTFTFMPLSMSHSGNQTNNTRIVNAPSGIHNPYRFQLRNNLGVPVRVTGTYTYNKPAQQFTTNGGLANKTVTIGLIGATTLSQEWSSIISAAANDWSNSDAGTTVNLTTSGPQPHSIRVDWFTHEEVPGLGQCDKLPNGNFVATSSLIRINLNNVSTFHLARRSVVSHEIGHLFWLGDNPNSSNLLSSLMNHGRDRDNVFAPRVYDVNNVRWIYG